ncbi:MAG: hypothetical protein JW751_04585 [Polyangiaceae bacterium]|nr:hypothetical protein [Polyangiaceae bacterium]
MHCTSGVLRAALLGAGFLSFAGCGKKDDDHPPPVEITGGSAGEGNGMAGASATSTGGTLGGTGGGGTSGAGTDGSGGVAGGGATGTAGAERGGTNPGGAGSGGGGTGGTEPGGRAGEHSGGLGGAAGGGGGGAPNGGADTGGTGGSLPDPVGDPCSGSHEECPGGQFCYQGITSIGSCRVFCELEDVGTDVGCDPDQLCTAATYGSAGACLQRCTPFITPSECPATEWCMPHPSVSYTDGVAVDGLCVEGAASTTESGESCEGGEPCADGLMCYYAASAAFGFDACEPLCDPEAEAGATGACPEGAVCRTPLNSPTSGCVTLCDPFGAATCEGGDHCVVFLDWVDGDLVLEGHCVKPGTRNSGEACRDGECAAGLDCIEQPQPFEGASTCHPTCDTEAEDTCGSSAACIPIGDSTSGVGTCEIGCTVFEEGADAGCEESKWCAPTFLGGDRGLCTVPGAVDFGEVCEQNTDCGFGGYCECRFGRRTFCPASICVHACLPGATSGDPDGCGDGETCVRPFAGRAPPVPASFGICRATCEFDGDATCPDGETCVPGALLADGEDACIDIPETTDPVGEWCIQLGIDEGEPCGPTDVCVLLPEQSLTQCLDACRFSEGGVGTTNHPDCADAGASCEEIAAGLDYGQCVTE